MALPPPIWVEMGAFSPAWGWGELSARQLYTTAPGIGLIDGQVNLWFRGGCHACLSSVRVKGLPTRAAAAACPDRLPRLQQVETLLHGLLRFDAQNGLVIIGQQGPSSRLLPPAYEVLDIVSAP